MEKDTKKNVKSRIVSAAWQLFYEKGYNGTTVDDIIELSGTSKGSFYYYFSTKDELLNTEELAAELIRVVEANYPGTLKEKYRVERSEEAGGNTEVKPKPYQMLEQIARSRHCLLRGNELDTEKAAILLLDDFRNGRLGRLTLEYPKEV